MIDLPGRRTVSVRSWFALAAITTFVVVVIVALVSVLVFGASSSSAQDRISHAAATLRDGADDWDDPAWREATADDLGDDDVSFTLFEGGEVRYRSPSGGAPTSGTPPADPTGDAGFGDGAVRSIEVDGSDPLRTAQLHTPLDDESALPEIVRATLFIAAATAAVSLAYGRPIVRSLGAVRQAAGRVAEGDMAVSLPPSRLTEIDEVNTAFEVMTTELDRSLAQQADLEQERRLFVAAIAHDLRTPLFSLRGHLEGLETGIADTPEKRARYLAVASANAQSLDRLVTDLFDHARLEYLDQALRLEALDLVELLQDLVDGLRPRAEERDVTLELRPHRPSGPIEGDRELLIRAASNLVDNAIRHTPPGGRIAITCGVTTDGAWFSVADSGPGIDAADLPHLFEPLYRGNRAPSGTTGGVGLGLAVARRVVVAHHGTLEAANAPTGGAVLTARLPMSQARQDGSGHGDRDGGRP